ncbi:MAG: HD domain-containing protein [bacterium]
MIEQELAGTLSDSVAMFLTKTVTLSEAEREELMSAFFAMSEYHGPQVRKRGQLYVIHPIQATTLLLSVGCDLSTAAAALLHDTVEDTHATLDLVRTRFGEEIASLVDAVSRDEDSTAPEFFEKIHGAAVRDHRVAMIKLADQITNLHDHDQLHFSPEKHLEHLEEMESFYLARLSVLPDVPKVLVESAQRVTAGSWEDYHSRSK